MNNQLLPIGSVVLLKGGTKELMINGYYLQKTFSRYPLFVRLRML